MVKTVWLGVIAWIMLASAIAVGTHHKPPGGGGPPPRADCAGPVEINDYIVGEWYHADEMPHKGQLYKCNGALYTHYLLRINDSGCFEGGVHPLTRRYAWLCVGSPHASRGAWGVGRGCSESLPPRNALGERTEPRPL